MTGSSPKPVTHTTAAGVPKSSPAPTHKTTTALASKGTAAPSFHIGQISVVSNKSGTLCLAVPVSATNSGSGAVYALTAEVQLSGWSASTGKASFPVAAHGSHSATFTVCAPGSTYTPGTCDAAKAAVLHYWGDPTPSLATLYGAPSSAGSVCF